MSFKLDNRYIELLFYFFSSNSYDTCYYKYFTFYKEKRNR